MSGPKPRLAAQKFERDWVERVHNRICMQGCAVDVYVVQKPKLDVKLRATMISRKAKRLPPDARLVGRYAQPFCGRQFLDDVAATLAAGQAA